jgi:CheY-like chemotaxis protein
VPGSFPERLGCLYVLEGATLGGQIIARFDADGHGAVIAEALADGLTPFLGLHYPASDIPKQARALYLRNWLRLIPDARYTPTDIVPTLTPGANTPLDLSYSVLRSVSPIHLEYLANMGVRASMSISLIDDGELWGLMACHHYAPKYLPYEIRTACEFLGQAVSLQLAAKQNTADHEYRERINAAGMRLVQQMAQAHPWHQALTSSNPNMLDLLDAGGAALCVDGRIDTLGRTPALDDIRTLIAWLGSQPDANIYSITSLANEYPALAGCKDTASGVLAAPIARCVDGDDALDRLFQRGMYSAPATLPIPSLILLDLNLPATDGREVLEMIKRDETLKSIPVVILTTSSNPKDIEECYRNGANSYLLKPVNLQQFTHQLKLMYDYWFNAVLLPGSLG